MQKKTKVLKQRNIIIYCTYNELGIIYYEMGKYDLAEKYYKKAAEKNDDLAMYNLGLLYQETGKIDLAEKYYKMSADHDNLGAMFQLAEFYKVLGSEDESGKLTKLAEKYYLMYLEKEKKMNRD